MHRQREHQVLQDRCDPTSLFKTSMLVYHGCRSELGPGSPVMLRQPKKRVAQKVPSLVDSVTISSSSIPQAAIQAGPERHPRMVKGVVPKRPPKSDGILRRTR